MPSLIPSYRKSESPNFNKLTELLFNSGYNKRMILKQLRMSDKSYYAFFQNPDNFTLDHLKKMSYMTREPLGVIFNLCLSVSGDNLKVNGVLNESYSVDVHISKIKSSSL